MVLSWAAISAPFPSAPGPFPRHPWTGIFLLASFSRRIYCSSGCHSQHRRADLQSAVIKKEELSKLTLSLQETVIHASLGFVKMSSKPREPLHPEATERRPPSKLLASSSCPVRAQLGWPWGNGKKAEALHLLQAFGVLYAFCLQKEQKNF